MKKRYGKKTMIAAAVLAVLAAPAAAAEPRRQPSPAQLAATGEIDGMCRRAGALTPEFECLTMLKLDGTGRSDLWITYRKKLGPDARARLMDIVATYAELGGDKTHTVDRPRNMSRECVVRPALNCTPWTPIPPWQKPD